MSQRRAFRYKAYPTNQQIAVLETQLELARLLYNAALEHRKTAWERTMARYRIARSGYVAGPAADTARKTVQAATNYAAQNRELTLIRAADERFRAMASSCEQRVLRRLDAAFVAFYKRAKAGGPAGYPRFRRFGAYNTLEFTAGNGSRLTGRRAYFQGVGAVKLDLYRPIPDAAKLHALAITRRPSGWWVIASVEVPEPTPLVSELPAIGLDLGLRAYIATSDGEIIRGPRYYAQAQQKLRRLQRALARKQRGSNRRKQAVRHLARQHEHISEQRLTWQRQTAAALVTRFGLIAVEDLRVAAMVAEPLATHPYPFARTGLNRGAHDAAWVQFLDILEHAAQAAGVRVLRVDPANTSQLCSNCGVLVPKTIFEPVHRCPQCGLVLQQDVNAAKNVLAQALAMLAAGG